MRYMSTFSSSHTCVRRYSTRTKVQLPICVVHFFLWCTLVGAGAHLLRHVAGNAGADSGCPVCVQNSIGYWLAYRLDNITAAYYLKDTGGP